MFSQDTPNLKPPQQEPAAISAACHEKDHPKDSLLKPSETATGVCLRLRSIQGEEYLRASLSLCVWTCSSTGVGVANPRNKESTHLMIVLFLLVVPINTIVLFRRKYN